MLVCRGDDQVARIVAVNSTHRPPDALAPLINVRRANVTKSWSGTDEPLRPADED